MRQKTMMIAISIYQYLMLILVSIFLLIIPMIEPHQYFDSLFVDILARCILWIYFVTGYWAIAYTIKNRINKRKDLFLEMRKNIISFVVFCVSAAVAGVSLLLITKWSLTAFDPQFSSELIFIISLGNGAINAALVLSHYFFLPED